MENTIDSGPELKEVDPEEVEQQEMRSLFGDLEALRDIMVELNILTKHQGEQLQQVSSNVETADVETETAVSTLSATEDLTTKYRENITKLVAIAGGSGIGSIGFLANPIIGLSTTIFGGVGGWLLTRKDTINGLTKISEKLESNDDLKENDSN